MSEINGQILQGNRQKTSRWFLEMLKKLKKVHLNIYEINAIGIGGHKRTQEGEDDP